MYSTPSTSSLNTTRPRYQASVSRIIPNNHFGVPPDVTLESLENILEPLLTEISLYEQQNSGDDSTKKPKAKINCEALRLPGSQVLVYWRKDEICDTGWKPGWYKGTVTRYDKKNDVIQVDVDKEKGVFYKYVVLRNRLKLAKGTERPACIYEEITHIGAVVEMK